MRTSADIGCEIDIGLAKTARVVNAAHRRSARSAAYLYRSRPVTNIQK